MNYDKGPQLTVGMLKEYLAYIPDDVKIGVAIGDSYAQAHYIQNRAGELILLPDSYMQNAAEANFRTLLSFNIKK